MKFFFFLLKKVLLVQDPEMDFDNDPYSRFLLKLYSNLDKIQTFIFIKNKTLYDDKDYTLNVHKKSYSGMNKIKNLIFTRIHILNSLCCAY